MIQRNYQQLLQMLFLDEKHILQLMPFVVEWLAEAKLTAKTAKGKSQSNSLPGSLEDLSDPFPVQPSDKLNGLHIEDLIGLGVSNLPSPQQVDKHRGDGV